MRWRMDGANLGTRAQRERPTMIDGWPQRGETVLVVKNGQSVPLLVADTYVIEADHCAFVVGYVPGSDRPRVGLVRRDEVAVLANCPRCLRAWHGCACTFA